MTYAGSPVGPRWFQVLFPGLIIGATDLIFAVAIMSHPNPAYPSSYQYGLITLALIAGVLLVPGLWMGWRVRFRWRGWRDEEARRREATRQQVQHAFAKLGFDVELPQRRSKP